MDIFDIVLVVLIVMVVLAIGMMIVLRRGYGRLQEIRSEEDTQAHIDFDRDVIPVGDDTDATSLLMTLSMHSATPVMVSWDNKSDCWELLLDTEGGTQRYTGQTQLEVLLKAKADLV